MNNMRISDSEPAFSIGVAAGKVGIAVPTLRLYEKEGLIGPVRTSTNRRLYSLNDLKIVQAAQKLIHDHGLNFAGIRRMLAFLPCWRIRGCDPALSRVCRVPHITDGPCWSSQEALSRTCDGDCQSCPVYAMACHIGELSIDGLVRI